MSTPATPTALLAELADALGPGAVVTDPDVLAGHVRDWTGAWIGATPAMVRPSSTAEVAIVVRACRRAGVAIVPQGGNTGLVGGSIPLAGELLVSTSRLGGIDDVDEAAGQLTAGAGATLSQVQDAAVAVGWRYAVDLAARDTATIGGTIATNAGGLRVLRHGATRRQVLGVEAVLGNGDVISRLGGLVKDNTGYDLAGLLCGSEGTLGIVTRARLALVAAPGETVTALVGCRTVAEAVALVGAVVRAVPTLEAAELVLAPGSELVARHTGQSPPLGHVPPVQVVLEAVGPPDPTEDLGAVLEAHPDLLGVAVATDAARAAALWRVREAHTEAIATVGTPTKLDVTLPADRLAAFVDDAPGIVGGVAPGASTWLFGHVGDGNIHVNVTGCEDAVGAVTDAVLSRVVADGGSISAEHGIGTAKRDWLVRNRSEAEVAAMAAIKAALDPDGICNPAVLVSGRDR